MGAQLDRVGLAVHQQRHHFAFDGTDQPLGDAPEQIVGSRVGMLPSVGMRKPMYTTSVYK